MHGQLLLQLAVGLSKLPQLCRSADLDLIWHELLKLSEDMTSTQQQMPKLESTN